MMIHLHTHSEYSFGCSTARVNDLAAEAARQGATALALTDYDYLAGFVTFAEACRDHGIRPIFGLDVCIVRNMWEKKRTEENGLVLLARNETGYKNLLELTSVAAKDGFYYFPRVDFECLKQYAEGLFALTGAPDRSLIAQYALHDEEVFLSLADDYAELFDGDFAFTLTGPGFHQKACDINRQFIKAAHTLGLPFVAANNVHFLRRDDYDIRNRLYETQQQRQSHASSADRLENAFFCNEEEQLELLQQAGCSSDEAKTAVAATVEIAEKCDVTSKINARHVFPVYDLPEGETDQTMLRRLAEDGLEFRGAAALPEYRERLEHELNVIFDMGFAQYFLIVQDFINWAKDNGVPVGPGRGSGAGSLVAWCLRITELDPIRWNLLFERFLNPERVSLPDIDVDFCEKKRPKVIAYMKEKYGEKNVAKIANITNIRARTAILDMARSLNVRQTGADILRCLPDGMKLTPGLELAEMQSLFKSNPAAEKIYNFSRQIEGLPRHMGVHAAGLVCSPKPMTNYVAVRRDENDDVDICQADMHAVESLGLVKFDFLGLRTLTVIQCALDLLKKEKKSLDGFYDNNLDDMAVYKQYASGDTTGIFQMESDGMRQYLRKLKPTCFEDIIAMCALYRPGPLGSGMVDSFIRRKHGKENPEYYGLDALLEPILSPTYGVIVYQEQVMQIAQAVAGYTLGGADLLRRAMGKKKPEEMAKQRDVFLNGAAEKGISSETATTLFDLMEKFAEYGFNRSHSAAYALISYQTAWLRTHYPVEFFAALLTCESESPDDISRHLAEIRKLNVEVLPPDIRRSEAAFLPENGKIRYGLAAIKDVSAAGLKAIQAWQKSGMPGKTFFDFLRNCRLDKSSGIALCEAGALDFFSPDNRALLVTNYDRLRRESHRLAESGQCSLFTGRVDIGFEYLRGEEWPLREKLRREKNRLGGYFSKEHPVDELRKRLKAKSAALLAGIEKSKPRSRRGMQLFAEDEEISFPLDGELLTLLKERGQRWLLVTLEKMETRIAKRTGRIFYTCGVSDGSGSADLTYFPPDPDKTESIPAAIEIFLDKEAEPKENSECIISLSGMASGDTCIRALYAVKKPDTLEEKKVEASKENETSKEDEPIRTFNFYLKKKISCEERKTIKEKMQKLAVPGEGALRIIWNMGGESFHNADDVLPGVFPPDKELRLKAEEIRQHVMGEAPQQENPPISSCKEPEEEVDVVEKNTITPDNQSLPREKF